MAVDCGKTCQDPIHVLFAPRQRQNATSMIWKPGRKKCKTVKWCNMDKQALRMFYSTFGSSTPWRDSMERVECVCWWFLQMLFGSHGWRMNSTTAFRWSAEAKTEAERFLPHRRDCKHHQVSGNSMSWYLVFCACILKLIVRRVVFSCCELFSFYWFQSFEEQWTVRAAGH